MLGRMRARQPVFGANSEKIQAVVRHGVAAADADFPRVGIQAYEALVGLNGIAEGIATRLLALARPDRFVSLTGKSAAGLAKSFGLARSTLGKSKNYGQLLQRIYDQTWFRQPDPRNKREERIFWMRDALLDCFVYDS